TAALADATIDAGATTTTTVSGNYGGTLVDITGNATFVSGATDVATVDSSGVVTGVASGNAIITATCNSLSGDATVTVSGSTNATLVDLEIDGTEPFSVRVGQNVQLDAIAEFSDGSTQNVTETATWTIALGSANAAIVSNIDGSRGLVTGNFVGTSIVRAEFETESVTAEVQVVP
ncbi:MAG: Ig-like domain-containing protein, partial [Pseudomonadota bacterium]